MADAIIGTAGHIDHGKTSLVKALTGIDADRLKEEKQRGITIDLGFAHWVAGPHRVGFVDVPGHEKFVKNMLAGASGVDAVLLVIAADESIMPQTREHFDICRLLQIRDGVVALTKSDLVEPEMLELVGSEVRDFLRGSFMRESEILPVSCRSGAGMADLAAALVRLLDRLERAPSDQVFRLPIDRVFSMKGFGTVVTGTLHSGSVRPDQEVEIFPSGLRAKVRRVQSYGATVDQGKAGQRVALNLAGVDVDELHRGLVVSAIGALAATSLLDIRLELLEGAPRPLRHRTRIRFHHGSSELLARVSLLDREELLPGQSAIAQVGLEAPTAALPGDRFIIRSYSPMLTIGGGEVLDNAPARHRGKDLSLVSQLQALSRGSLEDRILYLVESRQQQGASEGQLWNRTGVPRHQVASALERLAATGRLRLVGQPSRWALSAAAFEKFQKRTLEALGQHRQQEPLSPGMAREELREKVFRFAPSEVFRAVLDELVARRKIDVTQDLVNLFGQGARLSAIDQALKEQIAAIYREARWQPPSEKEAIERIKTEPHRFRKIVHLLLSERSLVRLNEQILMDRPALESLLDQVRARFQKGSMLAVPDFKNVFGLTRKHAIPLLEHLDREKITRRSGDARIVL